MAFSRFYSLRLALQIGALTIGNMRESSRPSVGIGLFWRCPPTPFKQRRNFV